MSASYHPAMKKQDPKKAEIRKYFADRGARELIVFGKQPQLVRRISDSIVSVSAKFVEDYYRKPDDKDIVIFHIGMAMMTPLSAYPEADEETKRRLRNNTPDRGTSRRRGGYKGGV